jgi:hypothetical protein
MITMPNHIHFILQIVGANPCVCPDKTMGEHTGSPLQQSI